MYVCINMSFACMKQSIIVMFTYIHVHDIVCTCEKRTVNMLYTLDSVLVSHLHYVPYYTFPSSSLSLHGDCVVDRSLFQQKEVVPQAARKAQTSTLAMLLNEYDKRSANPFFEYSRFNGDVSRICHQVVYVCVCVCVCVFVSPSCVHIT